MLAGEDSQPYHGVALHTDEATGLPHPATLLQVLPHREGLLFGEFAAEQRCAFAFRETLLAGATDEHALLFAGAVAEANTQVGQATAAVVWAVGVLAAEVFQVI